MKDQCFLIERALKVSVVYCHVPHDAIHNIHAHRLVDSWVAFPPEFPCQLVVSCNGGEPTDEIKKKFSALNPEWFMHDDTGWDIGAYQAYCRKSTDDMTVFFGGSTYLRRAGWLKRMAEVYLHFGGVGLFGSCGHMGLLRTGIHPHIRTTGFWCSPKIMNAYPMRVTRVQQRYPFEHGAHGLTPWVMSMGIPARVVDFSGCYEYPQWNYGPQGYHQGTQSELLVGDRMTCPPMYPYP